MSALPPYNLLLILFGGVREGEYHKAREDPVEAPRSNPANFDESAHPRNEDAKQPLVLKNLYTPRGDSKNQGPESRHSRADTEGMDSEVIHT